MAGLVHLLKTKGFSYCFKQMKSRFLLNDKQVLNFADMLGLYDYLLKYRYVLERPLQPADVPNPFPNKVWVCWLQGMEQAPEVVQKCVESIYRHAGGKDRVIVLNEQNLTDYIQMPADLQEKWKKGIISNTHFSDLLRLALLVEYGGVWIDSTSYLTEDLPDYVENADLFCFKAGPIAKIIASNWFFVAKPHHGILEKTRNLLYEYWRKENRLVAYSIFHPFFTMAVESTPACREAWQRVPSFNDMNAKVLSDELFTPYSPERWKQIRRFSFVHKLSYKYNREEYGKPGTYYAMLMQGKLEDAPGREKTEGKTA